MESATTTYPGKDSHSTRTLVASSQPVRHGRLALMVRRLLAAIVNGSEHPCWRSHDVFTQLALLPPREVNRLLDSGRVTRKGES